MPRSVDSRPRSTREADALVKRALVRTEAGDLTGALADWRGAVDAGASASVVAWAGPTLARVQGRGPRDGVGPAALTPPESPASPAWERAWAGDLVAARHIASHEENATKQGLLGVLDLLEHRPESALALLDRAIEIGDGREELLLHRARALVHLGRFEEASQALVGLGDGEALSRRVVIALVNAHRSAGSPSFQSWAREVAASETHLNGLFSVELPALLGADTVPRALASPEALARSLEGLLDRMAGNLGPSPTFADVAPGGARRFVRVDLPRTTRSEAVDALNSLRHTSPAAVEAALLDVLARHPRSIHAHTYRGELYLWLGRYDEAADAFAAASGIGPARWADIGMLATLVFTGRTRRASFAAFRAERRFSYIPGSTLPVYRGALRRRTGQLAAAIDDLRAAIAAKPTRIGARMELCLALRAAGARADAVDHAAEMVREAAPILVDAADALGLDWRSERALLLGDEVLEQALRSMRGNRSSSIVSWIDQAGELRILEKRAVLQEEARKVLSKRR